MSTAAIVGGSLAGATIGAVGSNLAAGKQAKAADQAAQLQHEDAQAALNFQEQVFGQQQRNIAPWLQLGSSGAANLGYLMGISPQNFNSTPIPGTDNLNFNPTTTASSGGSPFALNTGSPSFSNLMTGQPPIVPMNPQSASTTQLADPRFLPPEQQTGSNFLPRGVGIISVGGPGGPPVSGIDNAPIQANGNPAQLTTTPFAPSAQGPFANAPSGTVGSLVNPQLGSFGSLMTPFGEQFRAPTNVTEQSDPGFQFRLDEGQRALERSAAAKGDLLTGGTAKDLQNYAQNYASNEYSNVYGRALGEFQQRYNIYNQNQANQFNRLAALSGVGQTAAGQIGQIGQNAAGNVGSILLGSGQQIGQSLQNAGAARASGYAGAANAFSGAFGGIAGLYGLQQLMQNQGNIFNDRGPGG